MRETSKCHDARLERGDFDRYLRGDGIDIGAGDDPLKIPHGTVLPWDKNDGDAQTVRPLADGSFDFVYSSHCLEHLHDVEEALTNWARILKPGGWLYVVVPDYVLYEKLTWPSPYNPDHKHSFSDTVTRAAVRRTNHWHMAEDLLPLLSRVGIDEAFFAVESRRFNFNAGMLDQTTLDAVAQIYFVGRKGPL